MAVVTVSAEPSCLLPDAPLLYAEDRAFIRAPEALLYRRLTHIAAWPGFWPRLTVAPAPTPSGEERWLVTVGAGWGRELRLVLRPHGYRHDLGFTLGLAGDLVGRGEFWLEPTHGGTVVHHLLVVRSPLLRPHRALEHLRRGVRAGLWGCKDAVQIEVRTAGGLVP